MAENPKRGLPVAMKRPRWIIVTLVLVLTLAVIATPPTIARLFDDEIRADNYCRQQLLASANEYVIETRQGSYTCTYRRNGRVISIVNVSG